MESSNALKYSSIFTLQLKKIKFQKNLSPMSQNFKKYGFSK